MLKIDQVIRHRLGDGEDEEPEQIWRMVTDFESGRLFAKAGFYKEVSDGPRRILATFWNSSSSPSED
jgi:hypothetical protein